jgi:ESS family glutamate:Na+ symporter
MKIINLDIAQTVAIAAVLLVVGGFIRKKISILERFFIPAPVIGGLVFSILALIGYQYNWFEFAFYAEIRHFLLLVFFTTIGFMASLELLKKGGVGVVLFLVAALILVVIQNTVGTGLALLLGVHPYIGLSAGSVALTGGHGTSAAFGPILEQAGALGALPAAMAASTWGLVFGSLIGGPVGLRLLKKYKLKGKSDKSFEPTDLETAPEMSRTDDYSAMYSTILIMISIGVGSLFVEYMKGIGITLPAYIGTMLVAAIIRNVIDYKNYTLPGKEFDVIGNVSLSFFLVMSLMSMKLWELAEVAGPLVIILIIQTIIMLFYAYFVTFRIMGKDYDAAVLAAGHCGFGLGATPNAMANMEAFAAKNGPSVKAFFVLPLVGSLFIDFCNAAVITTFISFFQ